MPIDDIEYYLYIFSKNTTYINEEISEYEYKIIDLLQLSDLEKKKLKSKVYNDIYDREYNIIIEPYIIKIKNILRILSTKSDIKPDLIIISNIIKECLKSLIKDHAYISTLNNKTINLPSKIKNINNLISLIKKETAFILLQINNFILDKPLLSKLPKSLVRSLNSKSISNLSSSSSKKSIDSNINNLRKSYKLYIKNLHDYITFVTTNKVKILDYLRITESMYINDSQENARTKLKMKSEINNKVAHTYNVLKKYKIKYLTYIKELKELKLISTKYRINEILAKIHEFKSSLEDMTLLLLKEILLPNLPHTYLWYKNTIKQLTILYKNNDTLKWKLEDELKKYLTILESSDKKPYTEVYESTMSIPVNIKRKSVTRSLSVI